MTFNEGDRQSIEKRRGFYEEDARRHLGELHGIADGTIIGEFSVAGYVDEVLLHDQHWMSPLQFILEFEIAQSAFERLRPQVIQRPNIFPRLRSEVVNGRERFVVRITPSGGDADTRGANAEETTLQLKADWENNGLLLLEVPHPHLPDRLKRDFVHEPLHAEEVLDVSVLLHTPPRRNSNTFKSAKELMEEQLEEAASLARGFQKLAGISGSAQDLIGEALQRSVEKGEEELGSYPTDEECGMTEENYWYFVNKYGEYDKVTDPKDIELLNLQWDALQRRVAHDMRRVRRIRNAGNN